MSFLFKLNYLNDNILCSVVIQNNLHRKKNVYNAYRRKSNRSVKARNRVLDSIDLHNLFLFYYKINHQHFNIATFDKFNEFLKSFDQNPFRRNDNITFRNQLIESLIAYTDDYMSLISAVVLIKRNFTVEEIIENYYSNINVFDNNLF